MSNNLTRWSQFATTSLKSHFAITNWDRKIGARQRTVPAYKNGDGSQRIRDYWPGRSKLVAFLWLKTN